MKDYQTFRTRMRAIARADTMSEWTDPRVLLLCNAGSAAWVITVESGEKYLRSDGYVR